MYNLFYFQQSVKFLLWDETWFHPLKCSTTPSFELRLHCISNIANKYEFSIDSCQDICKKGENNYLWIILWEWRYANPCSAPCVIAAISISWSGFLWTVRKRQTKTEWEISTNKQEKNRLMNTELTFKEVWGWAKAVLHHQLRNKHEFWNEADNWMCFICTSHKLSGWHVLSLQANVHSYSTALRLSFSQHCFESVKCN